MAQEPTEEAFEILFGDQTEFLEWTHLEDLLENCKHLFNSWYGFIYLIVSNIFYLELLPGQRYH